MEMEEDLAAERPVWMFGLGLALLFGVPGLVMLIWRSFKREDGRTWGRQEARPGRRGDYLNAIFAECGKRGLRLAPGRTLRGLMSDLEAQPEFAAELVRYHYAVTYEGEVRDAGVEKRFLREIEKWKL